MDHVGSVLLIGGSSHVGKSAVADHIARKLGWTHVSTDRLARHPGRPWSTDASMVPPHVAEHYLGLTSEELLSSVLSHYRNMWPLVEDVVRKHVQDASTDGLVLEGSALWPENVAALPLPSVATVWLTAEDDLFEARIYRQSRYEEADNRGQEMIDKFLERTRRFNRAMMEVVRRLGLPCVEVEAGWSVDQVAHECMSRMEPLLG